MTAVNASPDLVAHFAALPPGYRIEHEFAGTRGGYAGWSGICQPRESWGTYHAFAPGGEHAGKLDYSEVEWGGDRRPTAAVHWIETDPGHTGKGVASGLMDRLYDEHPDHEVRHGYQTDEGGPWLERYKATRPERFTDRGEPEDDEPIDLRESQAENAAAWEREHEAG